MKFLSSLVLLTLSATFVHAQVAAKAPQVKTGVRTVTHLKKKVVISRRTEHVKVITLQPSAAFLAQRKNLAAAKSASAAVVGKSAATKASATTVHPLYGGSSATIVDSQDFGGTTTGGQSTTRTFTYPLPAGDTTLTFSMTAGVNFRILSSSCAASQCTVQVAFAPKNPGLLTDAISATDPSNNLAYQTFVSGNGLGAQFGFMFGVETDYTNFASNPTGTAWGPDGTFYVMDGSNGTVTRIVFGGDVSSFQIANLCNPSGIAVDGSGTVYVADPTFNQVVAYSAAGVQTVVQTTPLLNPTWVAVDGTGALYISDTGNGRIIKLDNHNIESNVLSGLTSPAGLAVDSNGNLYFADQGNGGEIQELVGTTGQTTSIGTEFGTIGSLSLDAAGDIYFTSSEGLGVFDQATGDTDIQYTGDSGSGPFSAAVSSNGNLLITRPRLGSFGVLDASTGNFGLETQIRSTAKGSLTILNTGNSPLSLTSLAVAGPAYRIDSSTVCNTDSALPPGNACVVTLDFTPPTIGNNYGDTFTATSNSLNTSGTQNKFSLFGTGDGAYTDTTLNINPQSASLGATVTLTAMVSAYSNNGLPNPTGTVNFLDGDSQLGSVDLSGGTAVFSTNTLSAGNHTIVAAYTGDASNAPSSSYMNQVTVGIGSTNATVNLSLSSGNISLNQPETLTATVSSSGATPTGTVVFRDNGYSLGTGTLSGSGSAATVSITVSDLAGGQHSIGVEYSGDQNYAAGISDSQTVNVAQGTSATTLSINPQSSDTEQQVTLTANVMSGTNPAESGLVIFSDQNGTIGYGPIQPTDTGGTASITTYLSAGSHQVTANYTQDSSYADSVSSSQTVTVSQGTPYVGLNVSAANIKPGQTEILTMQLGDGDVFGEPGTVTFSDQNGVLGTGTACNCYSGGYSTLQLTSLSPGVHNITGTYSGDSNYGGNTTSPQTVTVSGAAVSPTTTILSVSSSSINSGDTEILTAAIQGGTSPAETGTVTFADQNGTLGSVAITATSGGSMAVLSLTTLSVGTHQIIATYSGDGSYGSSVSAGQTVTVAGGTTMTPTTTRLSLSSASPTLGSAETFTALVSGTGNAPAGSVTFSDQNGVIVSADLIVGDASSTATVTYTGLAFGTHQVIATYNGTANYASSSSSAQTVTVGPATSTTSLTVNPATTTSGQSVTLSGSVQSYTNPALNGVISFADQNGPLGFTNISPNSTGGTASLTVTNLSVGAHQITAAYNNDYQHAYSISSAQTVTITAATATATTTTLAVTASATYKSPITLHASVTPASGTAAVAGQVIFCDAAAPRCAAELSIATAQLDANGNANLRLAAGTVGTHSYIAKFLGTNTLAGSTSSSQMVQVTGTYPTTTTITSSGVPGNYTLTSTVVGVGSRTISPTGTVTFNDTTNTSAPSLGNSALGTGTLGFNAASAAGSPNKTGAGSYGVTSGDFNGDGFMDIAVENYTANTVSVLLGNGDGTFQPQVSYAVGTSPERVLVADFNGDGIADLVVANTGSNNVSVLLGNGDGTFKTQVTYTAASPVGLGVMDLNHDGFADIVAGDYYSNTMSVLLGNGDGTFKTAVTYATGGTPQTLAEGDLNGDGNVDIAVGNFADNTVGVFLGNGDGTFQAQVTYAVGRAPQGVQVGDLNADGFDDLAVSNSTDNTISILLGNGDGTFKTQVTYPVGADPVGLVVADFNGDGKQDLSVGNTDQSALTQSILLGNGDGTFQPQLTFPIGNFPYGEAVADFNGDGYPDLAISLFSSNSAAFLLSQVTETATATLNNVSVSTGSHVIDAVYPGDTHFSQSTSSSITLNGSTLIGTSTQLNVSPASAAVGSNVSFSVTISGKVETTTSPTGTVTLLNTGVSPATTVGTITLNSSGYGLLNTSSLPAGTYSIVAMYGGDSTFASSTSTPQPLTITGSTSSSGTTTALQLSASSLAYQQPLTLKASVASATGVPVAAGQVVFCDSSIAQCSAVFNLGLAQLNANGAAVLRLAPGTIGAHSYKAVFLGTTAAPASVSAAQSVTVTGTYPTATVLTSSGTAGNYTLTGTVTGTGTRTLSPTGKITFNDTTANTVLGTGTLGAATLAFNPVQPNGSPVHIAMGPSTAISADLNGDGFADLAFGSQNNTLTVLLGNGDGTFKPAVTTTLAGSPYGLKTADFNGDGVPDLIVSNLDGGALILLGNGDGTFKTGATIAAGGGDLDVMDINHDGIADLVVSVGGANGNSISVLLGKGDGTFQTPSTFSTSDTGPISEGDFNGDGNIDFAVAEIDSNSVAIYLGKGDGTFSAGATYSLSEAYDIKVADFNGDGIQDLAVEQYFDESVSILLGKGDGTFAASVSYDIGGDPGFLSIGDFNGDGKLDITVGQEETNPYTQSILFGNGDGTFQPRTIYAIGEGPYTQVVGDFNGDGFPDIAVAPDGGSITTILLSRLTQTASATVTGVSLGGPTGTHTVNAAYAGDTNFSAATSAAIQLMGVAPTGTAQTITFPAIPNHFVGDAPFTLNASASSGLAVTYAVTSGPATVSGSVVTLTGAPGTVTIQATQAGNTTYAAATPVSQSFTVSSVALTLAAVSPNTGAVGSGATTVTLTGTGFNTGDLVQLNGATISSTYVSAASLTAVIPASFFAQTGTGLITVFDPASRVTTGAVTFTVANAPQIVFTGPGTSTSGAQPALTFQLVNPYPVALAGALNLTFTPVPSAAINDPAVQFASGGRTLTFNIPANSTTTPSVQLQTGTVAGTVTIALAVTANGVNVTPASVAPVVITIPPAAPTITSTTVTRSGNVLTVAVIGFSNTRETTQAVFHFTPVAGATISNPDVTLTVTPTFAAWYATVPSATYGSAFTYTQTFTLDQDAAIVQNVTVTLANTVGTSAVATTP